METETETTSSIDYLSITKESAAKAAVGAIVAFALTEVVLPGIVNKIRARGQKKTDNNPE